jgi:hypothetical protein
MAMMAAQPIPTETEDDNDIEAEQYIEQCQGMQISAIFEGDYSDDDND